MKAKGILTAGLLSGLLLGTSQAGLAVRIAVGGCAPRAPMCYRPVPVCPVYFPVFYGPAFSVGSGVWSNQTAFSNVSPLLNYSAETPVVKVPPPVALTDAEPIVVSPAEPFTWRP